jgi:serine/threonine-protein kinase
MNTPSVIGKYEILGRLGKGGMGVVFEARDPIIERRVAIKTISKQHLDPAEADYILSRFRREAQAAGRLLHPGIVAVYEYGEDDDLVYIAMEFVDGRSLHEHMSDGERYPTQQVRAIATELLEALHYSHGHGVVHRDIKPSNVLVGADGRLKISDFGIARLEASNLTMDDRVLGTPNYMSPEQFRGERADPRADIYSAAVVVYELLTGRKPFIGSHASVMRQVLEDLPKNPSELNPDLPPALDAVLQKALAKEPAQRFRTAREFAEALGKAIDNLTWDEPQTLPGTKASDKASGLSPAQRLTRLSQARQTAAAPTEEATSQFAPSAALAAVDLGPARPRLLFVDDEERILTALRALFRTRYHVFTATDGAQAMRFVRTFHMHVVVSDQRMPGMLGVDLLRQVKEHSPTAVRILLTGYSDLAAIVGSINDGEVYRFISKPWDTQDIQDIIAEASAIALEIAELRLPQAAVQARSDETILVADRDQEVFRAVRSIYAEVRDVAFAADLGEVYTVLEQKKVAVVLADITSGSADNASLLRISKQEHPHIVTVVMTDASDSELVIDLINSAQIYRFLNKPINVRLLKQHLQAALERYQTLQAAPAMLKVQKVKASAKVAESSVTHTIMERLRALRWRFGRG